MRRLGEEDVHYGQDAIGENAIPCVESLIVDLFPKYKDKYEDGDENDSDADNHVMAAAIHDDDNVSEELPVISGGTLLT